MEIEKALEEAGLTKNEARVYLALSQTGLSSAYKIAKEANMHKANVYDSLKSLVEKNLALKLEVDNKIVYEATEPRFILDLLKSREENIIEAIPSIKLMQQQPRGEKTAFKIYKGVGAFVNILFHFLSFKEPIFVYGAPKKAYELIKSRIGNFHKERIKRKIKMYHIYNFEAIERIKQLKKMPLTPVRILPALFDSQVSTNICGDEVVFVVWNPPVKVIQIRDKDMAKAYKKYFEILWKKAR